MFIEGMLFNLKCLARFWSRRKISYGVVFLSLSLGIAINIIMFQFVNALLLQPLPFKDVDQIVTLWEVDAQRGGYLRSVSLPNFLDWRKQAESIKSIAAYRPLDVNVYRVEQPLRVRMCYVSPSFFQVLGGAMRLGRNFNSTEEDPGNNNVAILSQSLFDRLYSSEQSVIGHTLKIDGIVHTIIGVVDSKVVFPRGTELWAPLPIDSPQSLRRERRTLRVIAKIGNNTSVQRVQAQMDIIAERLATTYPGSNRGFGVRVVPLSDWLLGDMPKALLFLQCAAGLIFLIITATVVTLLLARLAERKGEIAVRRVLGATRWSILRLVLTETVVIALVSGAVAVWIAHLGQHIIRTQVTRWLPSLTLVTHSPEIAVISFTIIVSLLTGIVLAVPLLAVLSKDSLSKHFSGRTTTQHISSRRHYALFNFLTMSEVAVALILLVGATVLVKSFLESRRTDKGFVADGVTTFRISLNISRYANTYERYRYYQEILERARALPGATAAAVISESPLSHRNFSRSIILEGQRSDEVRSNPTPLIFAVSSDYLKTMRIPLLKGREVAETDSRSSPRTAVINEALMRLLFRDRDPIGVRIKVAGPASEFHTIVGVVGDVRHRGLHMDPWPQVYVPYSQMARRSMTLLVRSEMAFETLVATVRQAVSEVDRQQPIYHIRRMEDIVASQFSDKRFSLALVGLFSMVGLTLAASGVYGLVSHSIRQRWHSIGIRMALGASPRTISTEILRQGLVPVVLGTLLGSIVASGILKIIPSIVHGVITERKPALLVLVPSIFLFIAGFVASYIPSRKVGNRQPSAILTDR